jgi:sigma-B regulation protein RsbU (phosphoserine phosphatase)
VRNTLKEINSNILVPFGQNGTMYGMISLGEKLSELPYSSNEINVLLSIATQITVVIDRIWLLKEVSHQERLKKEIEIAQAVQTRLFPKDPMRNDGLEIIGNCIPARLVGGDYYDYIEHGDGKLGIAIGDAAGKGISGALMMSSLRSSLRSIVLNERLHLSRVVYNLNNILCDSINPDKFVTFFYCVYDQAENTITYVNAGHDPPIILRGADDQPGDIGKDNGGYGSDIIYADKHGVVLGVLEDYDYEQHTIHLSKGDIFLAYTDGIPEARNTLNEEYGVDRLKAVVCKHAALPVRMIKSMILEDIRNFIGDQEQQDDITLILAKV